MAKSLSSLAVGALVKDTGTLYNGKPIIWKIADKNHAGFPANSVTLITERIISLKCFDAMEPVSYTHLDVYKRQSAVYAVT